MGAVTPFVADASTLQWRLELKERAKRGDRPRDKAYGRWLGDFLDQDTAGGLRPAEERLLQDVARGNLCEVSNYSWHQQSDLDELRKESYSLRPTFVRFLALGGDENAPVHEAGLLVEGGFIDG